MTKTPLQLANAFSLQMLDLENFQSISIDPRPNMKRLLEEHTLVSVVGHEDTAQVFSYILGFHVPTNRVSIHLDKGSRLLVGQITGGRLPAGATKLPPGFDIKWVLVSIG